MSFVEYLQYQAKLSLYQNLSSSAFWESYRRKTKPPKNADDERLEIWILHGAQDYLCTQYENTIHPINEGPIPEVDTHPNCKCERVPFNLDAPVAKPKKRKPKKRKPKKKTGKSDWGDLRMPKG